jgi:hypothetical protein
MTTRKRSVERLKCLVAFCDAWSEECGVDDSGFPPPPDGWDMEHFFQGDVAALGRREYRLRIMLRYMLGDQLDRYGAACRYLAKELC